MSTERMFPIQSERDAKPFPMLIPWPVAELAYSVYAGRYGRSQSLERLSERGGFGPSEMDMFLPDWRERCDRIKQLESVNADLLSACKKLVTALKESSSDRGLIAEHGDALDAGLAAIARANGKDMR